MVEKIDIFVNTKELIHIFNESWANRPWTNSFPTVQSGVSCVEEKSEDYLSACLMKMEAAEEFRFKFLHKVYARSYLGDLIGSLPFEVFRWRWMILNPKSCYSLHKDWTQRIHIPVITNDQSFLIFKNGSDFFHLEVGSVYKVDTRNFHTAINGQDTWRVHLVGCMKE